MGAARATDTGRAFPHHAAPPTSPVGWPPPPPPSLPLLHRRRRPSTPHSPPGRRPGRGRAGRGWSNEVGREPERAGVVCVASLRVHASETTPLRLCVRAPPAPAPVPPGHGGPPSEGSRTPKGGSFLRPRAAPMLFAPGPPARPHTPPQQPDPPLRGAEATARASG